MQQQRGWEDSERARHTLGQGQLWSGAKAGVLPVIWFTERTVPYCVIFIHLIAYHSFILKDIVDAFSLPISGQSPR